MDNDFEDASQELFRSLGMSAAQIGAMVAEAARPERFEYVLALWHEVNALAREGWRMVPGSAHPMPVTWTDPDSDAPMQGARTAYVMERKLGPESEAEEILRGVREGTIPVVEYVQDDPEPEDGEFCTCTPEQAAAGPCGKPEKRT